MDLRANNFKLNQHSQNNQRKSNHTWNLSNNNACMSRKFRHFFFGSNDQKFRPFMDGDILHYRWIDKLLGHNAELCREY